jgi:hypothetical protein
MACGANVLFSGERVRPVLLKILESAARQPPRGRVGEWRGRLGEHIGKPEAFIRTFS